MDLARGPCTGLPATAAGIGCVPATSALRSPLDTGTDSAHTPTSRVDRCDVNALLRSI